MIDATSYPVNARLRDAIASLYQTFNTSVPSQIEGCACCIETRGVDVLLTTPLRELTGDALWRYVSGVFYTIGSEHDFRYFLPRILELSVCQPEDVNDPEIVLHKLGLANWHLWPAQERAAITTFVDAWFEYALALDLSDVEDGLVRGAGESVLCGAARAGLPLAHWLGRLQEPFAAPVLQDLNARFPGRLSPFWDECPDGLAALAATLGEL